MIRGTGRGVNYEAARPQVFEPGALALPNHHRLGPAGRSPSSVLDEAEVTRLGGRRPDGGTTPACARRESPRVGERSYLREKAPSQTPAITIPVPARNLREITSPANQEATRTVTTGKSRKLYDVAEAVQRWSTNR